MNEAVFRAAEALAQGRGVDLAKASSDVRLRYFEEVLAVIENLRVTDDEVLVHGTAGQAAINSYLDGLLGK